MGILLKVTLRPAGTKMRLSGAQPSTGLVFFSPFLPWATFSSITLLIITKVHDENIVPLKLAIMKHLPVLGKQSSSLFVGFHQLTPGTRSIQPEQGVFNGGFSHHIHLL